MALTSVFGPSNCPSSDIYADTLLHRMRKRRQKKRAAYISFFNIQGPFSEPQRLFVSIYCAENLSPTLVRLTYIPYLSRGHVSFPIRIHTYSYVSPIPLTESNPLTEVPYSATYKPSPSLLAPEPYLTFISSAISSSKLSDHHPPLRHLNAHSRYLIYTLFSIYSRYFTVDIQYSNGN